MKKLLMITLSLLLFTFLISPVQAKRPGPLDRPLPDYNNLTLRQIFEDNNIAKDGLFDKDTNADGLADGWQKYNGTATLPNGQRLTVLGTPAYMLLRHPDYNIPALDKLYIRIDIIDKNTTNRIDFLLQNVGGASRGSFTSLQNGTNTFICSATETIVFIAIYTATPSGIDFYEIDNFFMYNLTDLGISTATTAEMDNLYSDYLKYKDMMTATDVMLIVGQLVAFAWSLIVSFEVFGFVLWEYAIFGIGAGFIGYLALKIIQKKAGDDNGDSD